MTLAIKNCASHELIETVGPDCCLPANKTKVRGLADEC
jgi:hypothetical protein